MCETLNINCDEENIRLDKYISSKSEDITRSAAAKLIESGNILVNNIAVNKKYLVCAGDKITINFPEAVKTDAVAENIPLDIVYEDEYLLVVNKPKGMVVHEGSGNYTGTLVNALLYHCKDSLSGINGVMRPGIVHRIDKNTSGLLMVAKTDKAHVNLAEQIKNHTVKREYRAVIHGRFKEPDGIIDANIGRNPKDRIKMAVIDKGGRRAVTYYHTITEYNGYSYMKFHLETGRTHQIRVHMAYNSHPIVNDDLYGYKNDKYDFEGQCLHAKTLGFVHPVTNEYMEFTSELPDYFIGVLKKHKLLTNDKDIDI